MIRLPKSLRSTALCTVINLVLSTGAAAQSYSDSQLLAEGQQAWERLQCVRAARFLFAYQLRNTAALQSDPALSEAIQTAITWCEANAVIAAGGKADDPADRGLQRPHIDLRPRRKR